MEQNVLVGIIGLTLEEISLATLGNINTLEIFPNVKAGKWLVEQSEDNKSIILVHEYGHDGELSLFLESTITGNGILLIGDIDGLELEDNTWVSRMNKSKSSIIDKRVFRTRILQDTCPVSHFIDSSGKVIMIILSI